MYIYENIKEIRMFIDIKFESAYIESDSKNFFAITLFIWKVRLS